MPTHLRPATPDEIADALSFPFRYQGRKRKAAWSRQTGREPERTKPTGLLSPNVDDGEQRMKHRIDNMASRGLRIAAH
jgi:hypothetical protein